MKKKKRINFYSALTEEVIYRNEIIRFFTIIALSTLIFTLNIIIQNDVSLIYILIILRVINFTIVVNSFFLIIISFSRLINISDNKEILLKKQGKYKFKYPAVKYELQDIIMFLKYSKYPGDLYVKSEDGDYYNIKLTMDYNSKTRVFFDPRYYINEQEYRNIEVLINFIYKITLVDKDGMVSVLALEEGNDPILLKNALEIIRKELKEKNDDSN